jgi:8-oxo-dGTP pyrophosphatase MutT (NUDIX family)
MLRRVFPHRIFRNLAANKLGRSQFSSVPLEAKVDIYDGVNITEDLQSMPPDIFEDRLAISMKNWSGDNRKGVWLRLPIAISQLVPVAVRHGFWFHHCNSDYLLMCNWLQGGKAASKLPAAPSHYIGVAGFVLNSRRELLVIQEKHGPAAGRDLWKLPGGLLDLREDIAKGVVREVQEETGVDCEFSQLVAIVEGHHGTGPARESASDLYCVSVLHCKDETQPIIPQLHEIEKCEWMPVQEVLKHPLYDPTTAFGTCFRSALSVCDKGSEQTDITTSDGKTIDGSRAISTIGLKNKVLPVMGKRVASVYFIDY